jgi:hypothetical protein
MNLPHRDAGSNRHGESNVIDGSIMNQMATAPDHAREREKAASKGLLGGK